MSCPHQLAIMDKENNVMTIIPQSCPKDYLAQRCRALVSEIEQATDDRDIMSKVIRTLDIRNNKNKVTGRILDIEIGFWQSNMPKIDIWIDTGTHQVAGTIGPCDRGFVYSVVIDYQNHAIFQKSVSKSSVSGTPQPPTPKCCAKP